MFVYQKGIHYGGKLLQILNNGKIRFYFQLRTNLKLSELRMKNKNINFSFRFNLGLILSWIYYYLPRGWNLCILNLFFQRRSSSFPHVDGSTLNHWTTTGAYSRGRLSGLSPPLGQWNLSISDPSGWWA